MKTRTLTSIAAMTLSAGALAIPTKLVAQDQQASGRPVLYAVVDLGTLGGTLVGPNTINDRGWVVGGSTLTGDKSGHAFLWRDGAMTDLGSLGGPNSVAAGVKDNRGLVAGGAETASPDPLAENFCNFNGFYTGASGTGLICRGFVWRDGKMTALPTLGGANGYALSVNNQGQAVGYAENSAVDASCAAPQQLDYEAVVWGPDAGEIQTLPPLAGDKVSLAGANNASGLVAGLSGPCTPPQSLLGGAVLAHVVIWEKGRATPLPTLRGTVSVPTEINSRGQLTGASFLLGDAVFHAVLWQKGSVTDLGVLRGDVDSYGAGLNDNGQVVGASYTLNLTSSRPFLWQNGVMTDLSTLIKPGSTSLTITFANDINSRGEILAEGFDPSSGESRAVLLIPCNAQHADNKSCAGSAGATAVAAAFTPHPPWVVLPEQVRTRLQQRFGLGRVGTR
jgi:probable HAF family extracellular repeat protein